MEPVASRINDRRSDEDDQVLLTSSTGFAAKQGAQEGQSPEHGALVFDFGDVLGDRATENNGLPIPNEGAGGDLAQTQRGGGNLAEIWKGSPAGAAADG